MLIGVAVGEQFPKPYSCETFADLVKAESELPNEPPVMRVEQKISGEDAIVQFPDHPDKELEGKTFTYSVTLDNCKPVVNSFASLVQTDPSETRTKTRNTSELNKAVKFDRYLAGLYRRLSVKPAKIDISRGREYVNVPGVNFRAGDKAQMCLAAPGWESLRVSDNQ
ncbi:hypothetical protein DFQ27_005638 [Actinomortierella ambigua]|uniref:Uncharacterized protein n=1 Tax=Actinomortierella ambigua TaxID=1343610 RepID=A0A9P6PY87_9FUNG|nr:hypothetical protein DFQ27_005638 [Actinomortierella ambigua]